MPCSPPPLLKLLHPKAAWPSTHVEGLAVRSCVSNRCPVRRLTPVLSRCDRADHLEISIPRAEHEHGGTAGELVFVVALTTFKEGVPQSWQLRKPYAYFERLHRDVVVKAQRQQQEHSGPRPSLPRRGLRGRFEPSRVAALLPQLQEYMRAVLALLEPVRAALAPSPGQQSSGGTATHTFGAVSPGPASALASSRLTAARAAAAACAAARAARAAGGLGAASRLAARSRRRRRQRSPRSRPGGQ